VSLRTWAGSRQRGVEVDDGRGGEGRWSASTACVAGSLRRDMKLPVVAIGGRRGRPSAQRCSTGRGVCGDGETVWLYEVEVEGGPHWAYAG
jgi:hypothetical protein